MAKPEKFVTAKHPQRGLLWAAFDSSVHHLEGRVADRRFAAFLAPFRNRGDAEAALVAEGCADISSGG
jgi:hypothetical protein